MIFNLTQHRATPEQIKQGVKNLPDFYAIKIKNALTFNEIPTNAEMNKRAAFIAETLISAVRMMFLDYREVPEEMILSLIQNNGVMIDGAPFFIPTLESTLLIAYNIPVYYAFFKHEKHVGFVKKD